MRANVVDNPLRKPLKQLFLFLTLLTYIPFGLLVYLYKDSTFDAVTSSPLGVALLLLGGIAPTVAAVLVFLFNKDMGGLPGLKKGINEMLLTLPLGIKSWAENCYLLGNFGVKVEGSTTVVTEQPSNLSFGSVVEQGFPFYSANITYDIPFTADTAGCLRLKADKFVGALMQVSVDGKECGSIAFQPYTLDIPDIQPGEHTIRITLFGTRYNTLACLHLLNDSEWNAEPGRFRTEGNDWTDDYRFHKFGLLQAPVLTFLKK